MHRRLPITILITLVLAGCAAQQGTTLPTALSSGPVAPSPTSTPIRATPRPTPSATPLAAGWRMVTPEYVTGVSLSDVIWTGNRFVAAGTDSTGRPVFLASTDGVTWDRQTSRGPADETTRLAAGPKGVVAVGSIEGRPASWTSPDGIAWTEHRGGFRTASGGKSRGSVGDVVARGDGWLAVGSHDPSCGGLCAPDRALVWTSSNGTDWTEVPDAKALHRGFMNAVARAGDGFVAVGPSLGAGAAAWTSADGIAWSYVSSDPVFVGPAGPDYGVDATGVAERDGRIAVVGTAALADDSTIVVAWWSDQAGTWSRTIGKGAEPGVLNVAATTDGFLASGWSQACPGGIWASSDGSSWRCDASDAQMTGFLPAAIAASDTVDVAVGSTDVEDSTIWYRTR
jgi:hypothetical protein